MTTRTTRTRTTVVTVMTVMTVMALASDSARASALAREVETVSRGTYRARARESMKVRFTHDVDVERRAAAAAAASGEGGVSAGVDGIGNPGMVYARAFDGRGRSTFTLGAEDALVIETRAPPKGTRFFPSSRTRTREVDE
jgi:hypothetical protein